VVDKLIKTQEQLSFQKDSFAKKAEKEKARFKDSLKLIENLLAQKERLEQKLKDGTVFKPIFKKGCQTLGLLLSYLLILLYGYLSVWENRIPRRSISFAIDWDRPPRRGHYVGKQKNIRCPKR